MSYAVNIKEFIAHYIKVVIEGDLKKMLATAKASQEADEAEDSARNRQRVTTTYPMATPAAGYPMTTVDPNHSAAVSSSNESSWLSQFRPERARCAAPVAMTLFSVIDVMGNLLKTTTNSDARQSLEVFFEYAYANSVTSSTLSKEESGVLNAVFRNGCMHSFFPSGMSIRLDVNDTEKRPLNVDDNTQRLTLNVNYIVRVVTSTIYELLNDSDRHQAMQINLEKWISDNYFSGKTQERIDEFWNNRPY